MSLRIAFDLDGTLADLDSALEALADELFAPASNPREAGSHENERESVPATEASGADRDALTPEEEGLEPAPVRALTRRQQHDLWETVRKTANFWETLSETEPGIVSRLAGIAGERRWEVIFITQRPAADGDTTQRQTQRWLAQHGFEMPSVFVLGAGASRGKVAAALDLDAVVDDRAENCLDVKVDSRARAFLVSREPNASIAANAARMGIEVVPSIAACLDLLTAAPPERRGLFGRLRKITRT